MACVYDPHGRSATIMAELEVPGFLMKDLNERFDLAEKWALVLASFAACRHQTGDHAGAHHPGDHSGRARPLRGARRIARRSQRDPPLPGCDGPF